MDPTRVFNSFSDSAGLYSCHVCMRLTSAYLVSKTTQGIGILDRSTRLDSPPRNAREVGHSAARLSLCFAIQEGLRC